MTEKPRFIKKKPSTGAYVETTRDDAQGVSVLGVTFNLPGHTEIERAVYDEETGNVSKAVAPEATVNEVDGGNEMFNQQEKLSEVDETAFAGLMATTDLYEELIEKGVI